MQRSWWKTAAALLVAVALFAVLPVRAADAPFVGNWKVLDVSSGSETTLVLLQIADKDGKPQAKVLAAPLLGDDVSIENLKIDTTSMQFDIKSANADFHVKAYAPKADAKTKAVLGSITVNNGIRLAQFNRTDDTELSADDAQSQTAEGEELAKALEFKNAEEKQTALKEIIARYGEKPAVLLAAEMLLQEYAREGAKEEKLRPLAEKIVKIGARFGPEGEIHAIAHASRALMAADKVPPLAVEIVRRAEKSLIKDDPPARSLAIFKTLAPLLRRTGKADEANEIETRIDKLEEPQDAAYEKTAVPFKPEEYKARRNSTRVAVVELFTGAYCPPCVAADVAFDAALQTYKPKDVILLQYHLHIPRPDRLANADTVKRSTYYERAIQGVPTALINGRVTEGLGGPKTEGQKSYEALRDALNNTLETEAGGVLSLNVERKGDKIDINAEVTHLKQPGEQMKLRLVLIEDVVRYPGGNGQRLHHHVVRALPGGADGLALKNARGSQKVTVNLGELKTSLDEYLTTYNQGDNPFVDDEYPLLLKHLKVVALIQNDDNKEIVQAVQVDVPDTK